MIHNPQQVRLLYDQANTGLVLTLVVTLILGAFLLSQEASFSVIGTWWLVTTFVVVGRWRLVHRFRSDADANSHPEVWGRRFILGAVLAGRLLAVESQLATCRWQGSLL